MPTLGDYHNDPDLKAFILAEYVYDSKYGRVGRRGRKMVRRKPKDRMARQERNTKIDGRTIPVARVIWLLVHGDWPAGKLVFRNGDSMDLRVENLMVFEGQSQKELKAIKEAEELKAIQKMMTRRKPKKITKDCEDDLKDFILKNYVWNYVDGRVERKRRRGGIVKQAKRRQRKELVVRGVLVPTDKVAFLLINRRWPDDGDCCVDCESSVAKIKS